MSNIVDFRKYGRKQLKNIRKMLSMPDPLGLWWNRASIQSRSFLIRIVSLNEEYSSYSWDKLPQNFRDTLAQRVLALDNFIRELRPICAANVIY